MTGAPETKKCCACEQVKPRSEFYRNAVRPDGRHSKCRDCMRLYAAARRERLRSTDPGWEERRRAENREYQARWRESHRARSRQFARNYYNRNRDKVLARNRANAGKRRAARRAAASDEA